MSPLAVGLALSIVVSIALITILVMTRASKGYEKAAKRRAARGPQVPCSTCGSVLDRVGLKELRMTPGYDLGAIGDDLAVEVYRCPTCRKLELFLPPVAG